MGAVQRSFHSRHGTSRVETISYLRVALSSYSSSSNHMLNPYKLQTGSIGWRSVSRVAMEMHVNHVVGLHGNIDIYLDPIPGLRYPIEQQVTVYLRLVEKHVNEYDDKVVLNVLVSKLVTLILLSRVRILQLSFALKAHLHMTLSVCCLCCIGCKGF